MTDTPLTPPVSRLDKIKAFVGDLARPYAIIATSTAAAVATVITALRVKDGNDGSWLMGAIFVGVSAIYIGKAIEVANTNKSAAQVQIAKVQTGATDA